MTPGVETFAQKIDRAIPSNGRAALWLAIACLLLFLPGFFTLHPMDRDEPRFAQATRQMLESGDFVAIRFQDEARNKKPVGIYWAQAVVVGAAEALGVPDARRTIWLYRIPSLVGAMVAVLATFWAGLAFLPRGPAFLAALLLASTLLLGVEARLAKTDAVVAATVVLAMGAFARVYLRVPQSSPWRLPAIFWTAIGIGILVKGPITPMVPLFAGLALAARDRKAPWLRDLRPLRGLAWALLLVLPWFALIMIETGGAFLRDSVGADMLGKVQSGQESHGAPPLTYFAAFWATGWPLAPFALLAAPLVWARRRAPEIAFLLAWAIPVWLLFELVPTKLPHYVLPAYPALALLVAAGAREVWEAQGNDPQGAWRRAAALWLPGFALLVVLVGVGGSVWLGALPGPSFLVFGAVAGSVALVMLVRRAPDMTSAAAPVAAAGLAALLYAGVYGGLLTGPPGEAYRLSPRLAGAAERARAAAPGCDGLALASLYREPSLVFLTRSDILLTSGEGAASFLNAGPCRAAFVDAREAESFRAALSPDAGARVFERLSGVNMNGGRQLAFEVWLRGAGR